MSFFKLRPTLPTTNFAGNIFCQNGAGTAVERGSVLYDCEERHSGQRIGYTHPFSRPPNEQLLSPAQVPGTGAIGVAGWVGRRGSCPDLELASLREQPAKMAQETYNML